jgi:hypothetical protein
MTGDPIKRNPYPQFVADKMKKQLDAQQDIEIGYTIQGLSRYRLEDIQAAFEPLSADLASWFKRLAKDKNSPGFALKEMDRIVSYTDVIWPEMKAAVDECKDQILQMILRLIKGGHEEEAGRYVKMLRGFGVTWRELGVISGSLLESDDPEELRRDGRDLIIKMMTDKDQETDRGIFYVMYYLDDWGLNLKDWPEIRSLIDNRKNYIMKEILGGLARSGDMDHATDYARFMVNRMKTVGVTWPELDVIEKSVGKRLKENNRMNPHRDPSWYDDDLDEYSPEERLFLVRHFPRAIRALSNPSEEEQLIAVTKDPRAIDYIKDPTNAVRVAAVSKNAHTIQYIKDASDDLIRLALKNSPSAIRYFEDPAEWMQLYVVERYPDLIGRIKNPALSAQVAALIKEPALLGQIWTINDGIWSNDEVKASILRYVLGGIRNDMPMALGMARVMMKTKCPWPEFKTILRSLETDYPDLELPDDDWEEEDDQYGGYHEPDDGRGDYERDMEMDRLREARGEDPEQVIMRNFKHGILPGLRYMVMYDRTVDDMPSAAAAIEDRKEFSIRTMIRLLKEGDPESLEEALSLFRAVRVDWPELDVIEKSFHSEYPRGADTPRPGEFDVDDIHEADRDEDEEHDGEPFEYGNAWRKKLEYQEYLKDLRHDIQVGSWDLVAMDLIDIGMIDVEDVLPARTKELIENNKSDIIRGMLERMKVSRYTNLMLHAITALHNMGINWPELMIMNKSLMADKKD